MGSLVEAELAEMGSLVEVELVEVELVQIHSQKRHLKLRMFLESAGTKNRLDIVANCTRRQNM